jgi:hypothetical protein
LRRGRIRLAAAALATGLVANAALAEDAAPARALLLELNAVEPSEKGCRLTFVVNNQLGADLATAAFELALFDLNGVVGRLAVLEFRDLPEGKTKVSRFDLAAVDCGNLSRILVNDATQCTGQGVGAADCLRAMKTSSKATIAFDK